jgi:hypothetical protein
MGNKNEEQMRAQWRVDLARIAVRIEELKAGIETVLLMLQSELTEEIAALQSDMEKLEADMDAAGADTYVRQVAGRIRELSAMGDAAYQLLQASIVTPRDPTDAEIRALEAIAASAVGDSKSRLTARIEHLKGIRAASQVDLSAASQVDLSAASQVDLSAGDSHPTN